MTAVAKKAATKSGTDAKAALMVAQAYYLLLTTYLFPLTTYYSLIAHYC